MPVPSGEDQRSEQQEQQADALDHEEPAGLGRAKRVASPAAAPVVVEPHRPHLLDLYRAQRTAPTVITIGGPITAPAVGHKCQPTPVTVMTTG
jgi:hypothetical protein